MTRLERELLRLFVEAENIVEERYNGEHFVTLAKRPLTLAERMEMTRFEFLRLIPEDAVVSDILWTLCLVEHE